MCCIEIVMCSSMESVRALVLVGGQPEGTDTWVIERLLVWTRSTVIVRGVPAVGAPFAVASDRIQAAQIMAA